MRSHFGFARGEELVDDHLRAVGEVAELRLPQHQRAGIGERVAVLEAEHARLRKQRVVRLRTSPGRARSSLSGTYCVLVGLVDQHRMALAEGAALGVLAREPHAVPVERAACRTRAPRRSPSRCPRRFRASPAWLRAGGAIFGLRSKPSGTRASAAPTSGEIARGRRGCLLRLLARPGTSPLQCALQPVGLVRLVGLRCLVGGFQGRGELVPHGTRLGRGDAASRRPAPRRRACASSCGRRSRGTSAAG